MWRPCYTHRAKLVRTDCLGCVLIISNALHDRQGISHNVLRIQIVKQLNAQWRTKNGGTQFPLQNDEVVQFGLLLSNVPNAHATRIRFYNYDTNARDEKPNNKRSIENDFPTNLVGFPIILGYILKIVCANYIA
jgi:hypothetical protein